MRDVLGRRNLQRAAAEASKRFGTGFPHRGVYRAGRVVICHAGILGMSLLWKYWKSVLMLVSYCYRRRRTRRRMFLAALALGFSVWAWAGNCGDGISVVLFDCPTIYPIDKSGLWESRGGPYGVRSMHSNHSRGRGISRV